MNIPLHKTTSARTTLTFLNEPEPCVVLEGWLSIFSENHATAFDDKTVYTAEQVQLADTVIPMTLEGANRMWYSPTRDIRWFESARNFLSNAAKANEGIVIGRTLVK